MRKLNYLLVFLLMTLPFVAGAQAKLDPFDLHVSSLRILERKDVQAEIKITTAQRAKMDKFADGYNVELNAYLAALKKEGKGNQPMPDQTVVMMLGKLKQNVMALLTPVQLKRLREISLQAYGLNGIMDTTVAKKVGLSQDQVSKMKSTFEAGSKKANGLMLKAMQPVEKQFKGKKPKTEKDAQALEKDYLAKSKAAMAGVMPQVQKVRGDTQKAMLAIVTAKQRQSYLALQGKVFQAKQGAGATTH